MDNYIVVGKKILKALINNGHEAYFIGETVRDYILNKNVKIVNIVASTTINNLKRVFEECDSKKILEGCNYEEYSSTTIILNYENYKFYVQAFAVPEKVMKNKSSAKHYSTSLLDDLSTRDFTIHAIAMGYNGKLIDAYDGFKDIKRKRIVHIGNAKYKFSSQPELMIKAFALASELNYRICRKTQKAINRYKKQLLKCNIYDYMDDLVKVFNGRYAKKAILLINQTNIDTVLPVFKKAVRRLGSHYKAVNFEEVLLMSFLMNNELDRRYDEYISNTKVFLDIYNLASSNKLCEYDDVTLYTNGLEVCLEANYINYVIGRCRKKEKKIKKMWNNLPIKNVNDLKYSEDELKKIIYPTDYFAIKDILEDIGVAIITGEIKNTYTDIQSMVIKLLQKNNIEYHLSGVTYNNPPELKEDERKNEYIKERDEINLPDERVLLLEQQLEAQKKLLEEQQRKLKEVEKEKMNNDINDVANKSADIIIDNEQLKNKIKDNDDFKDQLQKFIKNYITDEEDN